MKIYIAHSRDFDYLNELYKPLRNDIFFKEYELILPHEQQSSNNKREFYNDIDLFIAECSYPSTGLGIELGFAFDSGKQIYCLHKREKKISGSLNVITNNIFEYDTIEEMINIMKDIIIDFKNNNFTKDKNYIKIN